MSNYLIPLEKLIADYYDPRSVSSVVCYARQLLNDSLRNHLSQDELALLTSGKGDFGNLLERGYFKVKNNNQSRPDIVECGIEIKTGQVKVVNGSRDSLKERLKISMIDYMNGFNFESLEASTLWPKLDKILLMLFRKDPALLRIDEKCVFSDLLNWGCDDIKQMSEDWLHIKKMVVTGRANELSEGQTWYLGACTAGADSKKLRDAPGGIQVKNRAFSLKQSYLNSKLGFSTGRAQASVVLQPGPGQTLDDYILTNISTFFGKPIDQVAFSIGRSDLAQSFAKNMRSKVARALLEEITNRHTTDVSTNFDQFQKAGVIERAVALETNGTLKESISFPAFKWKDLDKESKWEDSELYGILTNKFLFTIFQKTSHSMPLLLGCFFWTMPRQDLECMRMLWLDTKRKVRRGQYSEFLKKREHPVGHVRPHARDASDKYETPQGSFETKKSFWLNNDYVLNVIKKELML